MIAATRDGTPGLMIFDLGTRKWSQLLQKDFVTFPEWSRDAQFIYSGGRRIRVKSGKLESIADLTDFHLAGWWNGWMGLDPTDTPLVLRDVGSTDIYALTLETK
jgi:hypothetical protein